MDRDDVISVSALLLSSCFSCYYRTIRNKDVKKKLGTIAGLLATYAVAGPHILHLFISIVLNVFIHLYVSKKKCHLVSFAVSFLYLFISRSTTYFGFSDPPRHAYLPHMILTLKLVGLAFEINLSHTSGKCENNVGNNKVQHDHEEATEMEINSLDIFHYSFHYVGILTGPYYTYRTFADHLDYPFAQYANWKRTVLDVLKYVPLQAAIFFFIAYNWPPSYVLTSEFYERSWFYRYWYCFPSTLYFRLRTYIGFLMANVNFIIAGIGVYPSFTKPKPGQGPSQKLTEMKKLCDEVVLSKTEFNFDAVHNINPYNFEFCMTVGEAVRNWNMCVQYWFATYVYQKFPIKKHRRTATIFTSAVWHGAYRGYYLSIIQGPVLFAVEDIYRKLYFARTKSKIWIMYEWIFWFFKMHILSQMVMVFAFPNLDLTLQYYNSVYHISVITMVILYIFGRYLQKPRRSKIAITPEPEMANVFN